MQCDASLFSPIHNVTMAFILLIYIISSLFFASGFNLNGTLYAKLSIQRETNEAT